MLQRRPTNPQAIVAVKLAKLLRGAPSNVVTQVLNSSGVPRRLFVLASELEAQNGLPVIGRHVDVLG